MIYAIIGSAVLTFLALAICRCAGEDVPEELIQEARSASPVRGAAGAE